MSMKLKMWILTDLILSGLLAIIGIGLFTLRQATGQDNEARVEQLLQSTYTNVVQLEQLAAQGTLTDAKAKTIATALLRDNIYHDSEYVYVANENMNFVAAALDPQLHGTSFHEFKDAQGNSVGEIMLNAPNRAEGKLARYNRTQRQADGSVENGLSTAAGTG